MVIDLQVTAPRSGSGIHSRKVYPDCNGFVSSSSYHRDQLSIIKTNFLNPAEVTFLNVDDEGRQENKRKRLTTISSEASETESLASSTSTAHHLKKKIPDGGYGWVVVFASLMVSLIADGISFSFGLLLTELLNHFKEGTTKTAWVGSLFMAVPLLAGPIMSNLVDKYGCQKMTMIGGVMGCAGFVLSSISDSVEVLFFTFGIISGLGLGVIYVTAVVSIAFWFEAKRNFATGIGASGTGLGTFLYAPLTNWLIESFGWRGATLILGGTLLNFCVFGALMIDPDWLVEENKLENRSQSIQTFSNSSMVCLDEIKKLLETGAPKEDVLDTLVTNFNTEANQQLRSDLDIVTSKKYQSEVLLPTFMSNDSDNFEGIKSSSRRSLHPDKLKSPEAISRDELLSPILNSKSHSKAKSNQPAKCKIASVETLNSSEKASSFSIDASLDEQHRSLADSDEGYVTCRRSGMHGSRFSLNEAIIAKLPNEGTDCFIEDDLRRSFRGNSLNIVYLQPPQFNLESTPLKNTSHVSDFVIPMPHSVMKLRNSHKKHSTTMPVGNLKRNVSLRYSNYLKNMRIHRNSIHYRGAMLNTHRYRLKASSCPNIYRNSMTTIAKEDEDLWYDDFVDIIKSIFDFSLFREFKFAMMSLSTLLLFISYIIPYFYITEYLLEFGYSEELSAYLISILGACQVLGMVVLGWIGDQKWCNVTKTYAFCLFLCGLSVCFVPFATSSYTLLVILYALFGVTFASSFSFTPIITSRLVEDDFTLAYGLILLVQGIGSLVGPPLAGFIYDMFAQWDISFYASGICIALSGVFAYAIGTLDVDAQEEAEDVNNNDDVEDQRKIVLRS